MRTHDLLPLAFLALLAAPSTRPPQPTGSVAAPAPTQGTGDPAAGIGQDGSQVGADTDQDEEKLPFKERENRRIERDIQGAWTLTDYLRPDTVVPRSDVQGFAIFEDGYMMFTFQAVEDSEDFFFAEEQYVVQSGAFRYRMFDGYLLQVAGLVGYTNANEDYELEFGTIKIPREYRVNLKGDRLELKRTSGIGFVFRRMGDSQFPRSAIDQLQRQRSGLGTVNVEDFENGGTPIPEPRGKGGKKQGSGSGGGG